MRNVDRKKILCLFLNPGYLRFFDTTLHSLLDRGHIVHLAFDGAIKKADALDALGPDSADLIVEEDDFPNRRDPWRNFAESLRAINDYVRYLDPHFERAHYLRSRMANNKRLPPRTRFLKRLQV